MLSAIGVLLATTSAARPAVGQERTERARLERTAAARASAEDRHEARRRAATERREAVLGWHRARRAGLDPRAAADALPSSLARQVAGEAAVLPVAAGRAPRAGREAEPGPGRPAVRPAVAQRPGAARAEVADPEEHAAVRPAVVERWSGGEGRLATATPAAAPAMWGWGWPDAWWDHDAWWEQDAPWWDAPWSDAPGPGWDAWRGPFGFREFVCVGSIRDGRPARFRPFDSGRGARGRRSDRVDDATRFRARCQPTLPLLHGFALSNPFFPGFWDPFALYGARPWPGRPVPHRFEHRFRPPAEWAPRWDGEAGWFAAGREKAAYW
ncbi:MAG TPA: hypothetical protein VIL18_12000 [Longimicrobiales bacterium]